MKNRDIERYNLKDEEKAELRRLRNLRRKMKRTGKRVWLVNGKVPLDRRTVEKRITELQLNGGR